MITLPFRLRTMSVAAFAAASFGVLAPTAGTAQNSPVIAAFRESGGTFGRNLLAAADAMPADKYAFKPTPAQRSFGEVLAHVAEGNDYMCSAFGPVKLPVRAPVNVAAGKDALIARLKETFAFCDQTLAGVGDSKIGEAIPFGTEMKTRAQIETFVVADWADHYSQLAIYMRLNGLLPPTAKKP
ncbi:MAG TPA: DinB family protein [Gemmatimonadaceae bacterium]|nr:DinB family protein [Gemmatimonadaceae bacterium]